MSTPAHSFEAYMPWRVDVCVRVPVLVQRVVVVMWTCQATGLELRLTDCV